MRVFIEGIGLVGPGLRGWSLSRAVLAGEQIYRQEPTCVAASDLLPPAERRRAGMPVKLALAAAREAFAACGRDPGAVATVFASSSGDGETVHRLCEELAAPGREVSPTRFHNSVQNAPAGYWSIATHSREASTSLCCHDASFAAGLLEAATRLAVEGTPVALIAHDQPYPQPLHSVRPIAGEFGVALLMAPEPTRALASLDIELSAAGRETCMAYSGLEALRIGIPAARSLPLLAALARSGSGECVELKFVAGSFLNLLVTPCR